MKRKTMCKGKLKSIGKKYKREFTVLGGVLGSISGAGVENVQDFKCKKCNRITTRTSLKNALNFCTGITITK